MTTRVAATSSLRHVAASYIARAKTICIKMNVASRPPAILLEIARHTLAVRTQIVHTRVVPEHEHGTRSNKDLCKFRALKL